MASKIEINETLEALNSGKFHIECPSCTEEIKLCEAGLFHLDNFTPEGNIVVFRNLKQKTDDAITLFSNKDAIEEILMPQQVF